MSIQVPGPGWFKAPTGAERLWIGMAILWCLVLSAMMPYWHLRGKQNSSGESYRVAPADFMKRTQRFAETNKVGDLAGIPIAEGTPGGDVYMVAYMWRFHPILKLKKNQTYRLHLSSMDLQHGFSLQPMNMNFQILPGYDHVLTITPTSIGEFSVICNEFCGIGHHQMTGKIIVTE
ncbi:MAG: cytochrome C oxidase subunit II [Deltaproteobacteria bacterium]|nr:cytochrome C oxidase subunit II [Deltaproteobacteria bacterium]